jgi:ubiquinone/menaquinone biosynthesis C-methylase UbiE
MAHHVDIVILSNVPKAAPPGVEVVVGLPSKDPWSLPFAHKRVFAERVDRYDLFIYSENDMLITAKNIEAFLWATTLLPEQEIAGFLRTEVDPDGNRYYPDVNKAYHWDPKSVVQRGEQTFAFFTCEHAACYILTRRQLERAIASGGFLVAPHEGKYDLACTAATDVYTQCGFRKMICVTDLEKFLVPHLSNKYVGTDYDLGEKDFALQRRALLAIAEGTRSPSELLRCEEPFTRFKWCKQYYEPKRTEIVGSIPPGTRSLLSIGCGWGVMEECLIEKNVRVTGIPLDSVISACAEARGVESVSPDFGRAWKQLSNRRFDCVLIANILHLVEDPRLILAECGRLLSPGGSLIVITPNFHYLKVLWRRTCRVLGYRGLGSFEESGVEPTTHRLVQRWLSHCGLVTDRVIDIFPKRAGAFWLLSRVASPFLASELIAIGQKKSSEVQQSPSDLYSVDQSECEARLAVLGCGEREER